MDSNAASKEFATPDNFGIVDPEMTATAERLPAKSASPRRTIGFVTASSIVIANIIGTGIFTSLGFQVARYSVWAFRCSCSGSLAESPHFAARFVMANSAPRCRAPGVNTIFYRRSIIPRSDSWRDLFPLLLGLRHQSHSPRWRSGNILSEFSASARRCFLSFVVVWVVTAFHLGNLQVGSVFQNLSTLVKLLLIGALIAAGLFVQPKQSISFLPAPGDTIAIFGAPFAVALVYVMYSYSGWNAAAYISGEIKQPEKNVPRSLLVGTGLVIVIYVLLNAVFLATTPVQDLKGRLEVALIAGKHIFGTNGGRVAGAVICLGLVSAISSMTWIGPRVSMSMGEDHWLLRLLARKNLHGIPTNAIVLQLLIVNVLLLTRSFESVVQYTQFSLLLCSLFTVLGVMVFRATRPEIARPYRVWAYPMPPIIFAVITLWMMFYLLRWKTIESLAGLATALVGLLLYFCTRKRRATTTLCMKTQFVRNKEAQLWHLFGVHPPLPFRKGERRDTAQGRRLQLRAKLFVAMMLTSALSAFAQEIPQVAPRAIPVAPATARTLMILHGSLPACRFREILRLRRSHAIRHGKRIPLFSRASSPSSTSVNSKSCTRG